MLQSFPGRYTEAFFGEFAINLFVIMVLLLPIEETFWIDRYSFCIMSILFSIRQMDYFRMFSSFSLDVLC